MTGPPVGNRRPRAAAKLPEARGDSDRNILGPIRSAKLPVHNRKWRLLADRFNRGLLFPFVCSNCGIVHLDPIGWNGRNQPLCQICADCHNDLHSNP